MRMLVLLFLACFCSTDRCFGEQSPDSDRQQRMARRYLRRVAAVGTSEVKVRLIADVDTIKAGQPFQLGVHFSIAEGWHVYGHEAGEGFLATRIKLQLPEGFRLLATEWPKAEQVEGVEAGQTIPAYHHQLMPVFRIMPPATQTLKPADFSAKVSWQFCHKDGICKVGKGAPKLVMKPGAATPSKLVSLFPKAKATGEKKVSER